MIEFIRHGLAVGMLPTSLVETTGDIAFVPIRDHPPEFQTAIAIPSTRRLSAAAKAMLETIKRHAVAYRCEAAHSARSALGELRVDLRR